MTRSTATKAHGKGGIKWNMLTRKVEANRILVPIQSMKLHQITPLSHLYPNNCYACLNLTSSIPPHHPPRKLPKRQPARNIHDLLQIRLREHRQCISRYPHPLLVAREIRRVNAPHEVRHGFEAALSNEFEGFACLKGEGVAGDGDAVDFGCAGFYVEAGGWGGGGDF